nr:xylulose kinase-1 [Tanacetum cinerariifolium]
MRYALTQNPIIFDSLVKQFWSTTTLRSPELCPLAIQDTIDKTPYTIAEDLVRSRLQLVDDGGIDDLPIAEIYSGMDNLAYVTEGKLTFFKNKFSPQWRFFGPHPSSLSQYQEMVSNIGNAKKFLMYPGFLQAILGEGTGVAAQAVPQHMPTPDQPQDHLSTPLRQQTSDPNALVFEHGQCSDLNTASFSRSHETDVGPFTNVEDKPLGASFHMSPPRSTQAPPAGQPSGDEKDPITLTALSSVVSTLVQKTKKRKMVVSDPDQEDEGKKDVDLDALRALANAAVTVDSNIPPGGASAIPTGGSDVSTGDFVVPTGASTVLASSSSVHANVPPSVAPAGMEEDRLGEEAAKRLHDEEQAQVDRQRAELQRKRQQEVIDSAMYYNKADSIHIMAQVEANASLSKTLLGDDVSEDNFPARMAVLIKRKKQALAEKLAKERRNRPMTQAQQRAYMRQYVKNQSSVVYTTGWSMAYVKSFTDDQLKEEFEKIRKVHSNSQIQAFSKTLNRTGPVLKEPSSKRQKSIEAPIPSVLEVPQSLVVSSYTSSGTRRKSLARKRLTKPKSIPQELDLDADAQTFIKVVSTEDSDDEAPPVWSALVGWEVIPTPLVKLYGLVVQYYKTHHVAGVGLLLWGDLQVLFDSHKGGKGSCVWQHQHLWETRSWRLYTLSSVHILETVSGEVLSVFADVSYPLFVKLMEKMIRHKLEIDKDVMGNDMNTAEQLIQFIKNQLAAAQVSSV